MADERRWKGSGKIGGRTGLKVDCPSSFNFPVLGWVPLLVFK